jgi:hypothetical protein
MAQKVYLFAEDLGDGSSAVRFTTDYDLLDRLCEEQPEWFGMNEGYSRTLTLPDDLDLKAAGIDLYSEE